jgi:hypothetical protein
VSDTSSRTDLIRGSPSLDGENFFLLNSATCRPSFSDESFFDSNTAECLSDLSAFSDINKPCRSSVMVSPAVEQLSVGLIGCSRSALQLVGAVTT